MVLGSQTITVLDPGLGLVTVSAQTPLKLGACSAGTVGQLYSFSSLSTIRATLGYGDLPDDVAKTLREAGGPVLAMRGTGSVAAVLSSVVNTGGGPTVTVSGTPTMRTQTRVRVKTGGVLGTAVFDFSHDYYQPTMVSPTFSQERKVPAGGTFVFPNSGITATFPAGTYIAGATYDFTCEPAHLNASDLSVLFTALAQVPSVDPRLTHVTDTYTTATEGFAMASALGGQLQTLASAYRYARGFCDVGSADTSSNVLTAKAAFSDKRIVDAYGYELQDAVLPFEGWSVRKVSASSQMAARASASLISTDLARYASGSLGGSKFIYFDGYQDQTLDAAGIATLRTWPRIPGFYVGNGCLASPIGSDYTRLQFGRVMDEACSVVYEAMLPFIAEGLRTLSTGVIDPLDAASVNTAGQGALEAALTQPSNARGVRGHVSAVRFAVDQANNLNLTGNLQTKIGIRPLGYAYTITQQLGYTLNP